MYTATVVETSQIIRVTKYSLWTMLRDPKNARLVSAMATWAIYELRFTQQVNEKLELRFGNLINENRILQEENRRLRRPVGQTQPATVPDDDRILTREFTPIVEPPSSVFDAAPEHVTPDQTMPVAIEPTGHGK